jgi:CheY-like chemotaxis protein
MKDFWSQAEKISVPRIKMSRVLIVEDNITFRKTFRDLLTSRFSPIQFDEAGDGKEALSRIKESRPDIVFMDIKLPGENGLLLTEKIKTSHPEIPVIILTSHDLPEYRQVAREKGASHFFVKGSSSAEEILSLVETLLAGPGPGQ